MTITLWTIFEIFINFYQGGLETWFIYKFLRQDLMKGLRYGLLYLPFVKAVWSLLLIISLYLRALEVLCTGQVCLFLRFAFLVTMQ